MFHPTKPIILEINASDLVFGAIISQQELDKK